jgi:rRNA maturation endonuclease Nob1
MRAIDADEQLTVQPDVPDTNVGDTISRQAAIKILHEALDAADQIADVPFGVYQNYRDKMNELPPAQPERIKSKWALHTYMPHNKFCLACRNDSPYNKRWDFCPNCGAEMEVTT